MSVYPRADGIYVFDFWINGTRFYGSTGCTRKRAAQEHETGEKTKARATLARLKTQRYAPITVNIAFDRFWLEVGDGYSGSYRKTVWTALKWLTAELKPATLLRDIDIGTVSQAIARRRGEGVTNATVNRTVTELLRRILRRASGPLWKQENLPAINWNDLLLPEPKERTRELRDHEEVTIFDNMREDYRPALAFFIATGCRLKEVVGLRKTMFDWTARTITLHGKGGKVDVIPLTSEIAAIVRPLWHHHNDFVFTYLARRTARHPTSGKVIPRGQRLPITYSGMKTTWRRYGGKSAGLIDFRLHDTRHTAATRLLRESGNLKLVQRLLRHEDIATTAKYAHVQLTDLHQAMEKVTKSRKNSRTGHGVDGGIKVKSAG